MASFAERLCQAMDAKGVTAAELAVELGITDATVHHYKRGTYAPKQRRTEHIANFLNVSIDWLLGADVPMTPPVDLRPRTRSLRSVPRLGRISCGIPLDSKENFEGYDEVPEGIDCDYTLTAKGDSMTGARIFDGDLVYIRCTPIVESGEIAAVLIDGCETTLKRVYYEDDTLTLKPENPAYEPIVFRGREINRVQIIGKAVSVTFSVR